MLKFRNYSIFLPAFFLIKRSCKLKSSKNFEKIKYGTEVSFDTSEGKQLSYFQNGYFSKVLWRFHEPHNQVKCRQKDLKSSELFTIKILIIEL
jgi:hypothetical protein